MTSSARAAEPLASPEGQHHRIPGAALLPGILGVIPFAALAAAAWLHLDERTGLAPGMARAGLVGYGVVIISFLGGVRWGVGLNHPHPAQQASLFIMSILAPIVAWGALFMPRPHDLVVLVGCFLVLGISDVALSTKGPAPRWYARLRIGLTAAVIAILIVALAFLPLET